MKHQPFFTKLKKVLSYPFDQNFIKRQQRAIKLLVEMSNQHYKAMYEQHFNEDDWNAYDYITNLHKDLNKCRNLDDVTKLLSVEISKVLKVAKINMQIFDLKTKWFLWETIFLRIDLVADDGAKESAKRRLNILREISSIFDLGK